MIKLKGGGMISNRLGYDFAEIILLVWFAQNHTLIIPLFVPCGMESCTWYPVRDLSIWYFKLQPYVVMADLVFYGGPCPTQRNWFWDSDKLTCVHILKLVPANFIRNTWSSFWGVFTWNVFCLISQNDSVRAHTVINSASETSAKLTSLREPASVGAPNCEI